MRVKYLIAICCFWPLCLSQAASVRMLNGEIYVGTVAFTADGITVTSRAGAATKVDLSNLQAAVFNTPSAESTPTVPPGLLLINGSYIAGNVRNFGEPTVQIGSHISVPSAAVAQILFVRLGRDKLPPPAGGQTGAMLPNGDFFPGTVDGIKDHHVQINSLLIGPQKLAPFTEMTGLVLRDVQGAPGAYEVAARDGSRYLTDNFRFDKDGVSLTDSIVGSVTIKGNELAEIRAGAGRYQSLAEAKPWRIDVPPGGNAASAFQVQPAAADGAPALLSTANTNVTYAVPPGFNLFATSVAVAKDAPPTARLIFDVYADGRLIFGSPIVAGGANPEAVRVNLGTAVRMITLRAEPAGPGSGAAAGEWINPMFLRQR